MNIKPHDNRPVLNPCTLEGRNYQVDPYIGCEHYCYYCYALNQAETDWSKEILIHKDISGQLESELAGIAPQTIYMGWQTDPYQPCEAEYRQTRQVLGLFLEKGFSASILTKSDLVLRDTDLLQKMNAATVVFPWHSMTIERAASSRPIRWTTRKELKRSVNLKKRE